MLSGLGHVRLLVTPWSVIHQAPLYMGLSRQEYWSGLPRPPPGDLSDAGIEPVYLSIQNWQADSLPLESSGKPLFFLI